MDEVTPASQGNDEVVNSNSTTGASSPTTAPSAYYGGFRPASGTAPSIVYYPPTHYGMVRQPGYGMTPFATPMTVAPPQQVDAMRAARAFLRDLGVEERFLNSSYGDLRTYFRGRMGL